MNATEPASREAVFDTADCFDEREFEVRARIEGRHFWHAHRREVLRDELSRFLGERKVRLIEFGCGIGTVATHLNAHGFHVDYSDVFPRALEIARQHANAALGNEAARRTFVRADITQPLEPVEHDGVLLLDVLEHLPDDQRVLENVRDALPAGSDRFLVITVPAFNFLWSPWDDVQKHKRRYTKRSLVATLQRAGFCVERSTFFFAALFGVVLGLKGLRAVRGSAPVTGTKNGTPIAEMAETRNLGPLNEAARVVFALERPALRLGQLPLGTSLLAIARRV